MLHHSDLGQRFICGWMASWVLTFNVFSLELLKPNGSQFWRIKVLGFGTNMAEILNQCVPHKKPILTKSAVMMIVQ